MKFKFLNTKVDLSALRQGVKIDANNQFLKSYDKNNNSIFDNEELSQLYSDLEPLITDGELDKNESISLLAKVLNKSVEEIRQNFSNQETNDVFNGLEEVYSRSIRQDVLNNKSSEIGTAMKLYNQARGGKISDSIHNIFNPDYVSDKVYRLLVREQVSVILLNTAENGSLTMKNYLEKKIELLECFLGKDGLNEQDKELLNRGIKNLTPQELNNLIDELADKDDEEYSKFVQETINSLKKSAINSESNNSREFGFKTSNPNSIESILNSADGAKVVDYETSFKIEYGLDFEEEDIQNYLDKKKEFDVATKIHNTIASQYNALDEAINNNDKEDLNESIKNALTILCGNSLEKKNKILTKLGYSNLESLDNETLKNLAQELQKELKTTLDKQLNGKTIEKLIEELEKAETLAYGNKMHIKVAEKYSELTEKAVNNVKMAVSGVGFIATFAGGPMALVGMGISVLGGAGVSFVEEHSKGEPIPKDKQKEILDELVISGLLTASGFGSGIASNALRNLVANKCPMIVAAITEYGSDAVMSLLSDYAITGQVDLTSEGISQLINIATGVVAKNKIHKPKADVDANLRANFDESPQSIKVRINADNEYVVKIGDTEYILKNNESLQNFISENAPKNAVIDFSDIEAMNFYSLGKNEISFWEKIKLNHKRKNEIRAIYKKIDDAFFDKEACLKLKKYIGGDFSKAKFCEYLLDDKKLARACNIDLEKGINITSSQAEFFLNLKEKGINNFDIMRSIRLLNEANFRDSNSIDILKDFSKNLSLNNVPYNSTQSYKYVLLALISNVETNNGLSKTEIINIFKNYEFENIVAASKKEEFALNYLIEEDKKLFNNLVLRMEQTELKENESISDFFVRIFEECEKEQLLIKQKHLDNNKELIKKNYYNEDNWVKLELSDFSLKDQEYIKNNYKIGMSNAAEVGSQMGGAKTGRYYLPKEYVEPIPTVNDYFLQQYPRYNSSKYYSKKGFDSEYEYPPLYRVLNSGRYSAEEFLEEFFPNVGEKYHFIDRQCCSPKQKDNTELISLSSDINIQLIIHPRNETSKAHFIVGNGDESRYGTNVEFTIIDKFVVVNEGQNMRSVAGYVILQEL